MHAHSMAITQHAGQNAATDAPPGIAPARIGSVDSADSRLTLAHRLQVGAMTIVMVIAFLWWSTSGLESMLTLLTFDAYGWEPSYAACAPRRLAP
jgi:hypothetical protein